MSKLAGKVAGLLRPDAINLNLHSQLKEDALREVATLLQEAGCVTNFDAFFAEILERERVSNTALGHDVAIPHARTDQCSDIVVAVGRAPGGIDRPGRRAEGLARGGISDGRLSDLDPRRGHQA